MQKEELYLQEYSVEITLNHPDDVSWRFLGDQWVHLKLIEENLNVIIHARTERVQILGDDEQCRIGPFIRSPALVERDASQHQMLLQPDHGSRWFDW